MRSKRKHEISTYLEALFENVIGFEHSRVNGKKNCRINISTSSFSFLNRKDSTPEHHLKVRSHDVSLFKVSSTTW